METIDFYLKMTFPPATDELSIQEPYACSIRKPVDFFDRRDCLLVEVTPPIQSYVKNVKPIRYACLAPVFSQEKLLPQISRHPLDVYVLTSDHAITAEDANSLRKVHFQLSGYGQAKLYLTNKNLDTIVSMPPVPQMENPDFFFEAWDMMMFGEPRACRVLKEAKHKYDGDFLWVEVDPPFLGNARLGKDAKKAIVMLRGKNWSFSNKNNPWPSEAVIAPLFDDEIAKNPSIKVRELRYLAPGLIHPTFHRAAITCGLIDRDQLIQPSTNT